MSSERWAWPLLRTYSRSLVYSEAVFSSKFSHMTSVTETEAQTLLKVEESSPPVVLLAAVSLLHPDSKRRRPAGRWTPPTLSEEQ